MQLTINGVDFSELITKYGYSVDYKKILGSNSVYTLNGTYHEDVLAWKAVIEAELRPLKSSTLASVITICANEYVTVSYFDTKTNAVKTIEMKPSLSSAKVALINAGITYWNGGGSGITLALEEL